jgi:hypothetical protein
VGYLGALRAHFEGLLCDGAGSGHTLAAGRFARRADALGDTDNRAEREVEVVVGPGRPDPIPNPIDERVFMTHPLTVRVRYLLTQGGDDLAEGLTPQDGPGANDAVRDRADADAQDIAGCLEWLDNWPVAGAGSDGVPDVFDVGQELGADPELDAAPGALVLTLRFRVRCQTRRTPAALAP